MTHTDGDNVIIAFENMDGIPKNVEFYARCNEYFAALRKTGKRDDEFEDEFFYTMPTISGRN
jgi:hypothetical protein